jgi:hypothetical protein
MSLLALAALPATASATSSPAEVDAAVGKAVEYVRGQQTANGKIPGFGSEWMAVSLAAAGVSAADVRLAAGDPSLQDFWLGEYGSALWGDEPPQGTAYEYEVATIVAHAAGLDPARLSAISNQPAQLAGTWNPATGSFGDPSTNSTIFGILAMGTTPLPAWAVAPSVAFLRRNQHDDGGWAYPTSLTPAAKAEPSEEEMTGAAIAALCGAGVPTYDPAVASALDFLQSRQDAASGGIEAFFGLNADTNAWVVSGLTACGVDPQSPAWTTGGGKTPIDFLLSLQVPSGPGAGGFGYENSSTANFYATQDALRAIAGPGFTPAPPPRDDSSLPAVRPAPAVAPGTPVPHLLAIELAPGNVRICKVTAPDGAPLSQVLNEARTGGSFPAGCVSSFAMLDGRITAIDGVAPAGEDEVWLLRLDRGGQVPAGEQPVRFGETISLRLGASSSSSTSLATREGPVGSPGAAGPRGKPGAKRGPGRKGRVRCRAHRRRSAKRHARCAAGHRHRRHDGSNTLRLPTNP